MIESEFALVFQKKLFKLSFSLLCLVMSRSTDADKVYAVFLGETLDDLVVKLSTPLRWTRNCGVLFRRGGTFHAFLCHPNQRNRSMHHYENVDLSKDVVQLYKPYPRSCMHYSFVSDDAETVRKCWDTCVACVSARKDYNFYDYRLTCLVPFYSPKPDLDLFSATSLHSAQALVLILRCCLDPGSHLGRLLQGVNSRSLTPHSLARIFDGAVPPHALVCWGCAVKQGFRPASSSGALAST